MVFVIGEYILEGTMKDIARIFKHPQRLNRHPQRWKRNVCLLSAVAEPLHDIVVFTDTRSVPIHYGTINCLDGGGWVHDWCVASAKKITVRFLDEAKRQHDLTEEVNLPQKFEGEVLIVLFQDGECFGMKVFSGPEGTWSSRASDRQVYSIIRSLQPDEERSNYNFALLADTRHSLQVENDDSSSPLEECFSCARQLQPRQPVWRKAERIFPVPRYLSFSVAAATGNVHCRLHPDCLPLPYNFRGDIVALVHEGAGGFELRIFLAPFDSLATLPDAETLLKVLEEKYAASGDRRDVTENRAPSPNAGSASRVIYGNCELVICDGVLPPP